ncbi:MAG: hypothetical protein QXT58_01900 [Archaeoglobaceae archaeon]
MGKKSRRKGYLGEHEIEKTLREMGLDAVRVPLSGSTAFQKGDVVVKFAGRTFVAEVKRRKSFKTLYEWLEGKDLCFFRADNEKWLVIVPLETFVKLLRG